jgi:hypothetical protein
MKLATQSAKLPVVSMSVASSSRLDLRGGASTVSPSPEKKPTPLRLNEGILRDFRALMGGVDSPSVGVAVPVPVLCTLSELVSSPMRMDCDISTRKAVVASCHESISMSSDVARARLQSWQGHSVEVISKQIIRTAKRHRYHVDAGKKTL